MKNADGLYEKYYNVYKNDYDNDFDELGDEAKKKKFKYRHFELFKTNKKLTMDEETKKFFKEIENR